MIDNKQKILEWFDKNFAEPKSELVFASPFELLVAVILSAQCTDKRVNMVTPALMKKYPTPEAMAKASVSAIYKFIKSVSYPRSKASHLVGMAKMVAYDFGGEVPADIEKMMRLPGVGRKTANVVASICFNEPVIAVDTHVFRVAHRLGFSKAKTPEATEQDLEKLIPVEKRGRAHHWLLLHGRYVCRSQKPKCGECGIVELCPKIGLK